MTPSSTGRRRRHRYAAAASVLLTMTLVPGLSQLSADASSSSAPAPQPTDQVTTLGDTVPGLSELDARGTALPSVAQKQAAARLGAVDVRWNQYGTPTSLLPDRRRSRACDLQRPGRGRPQLVAEQRRRLRPHRRAGRRPRARQRPAPRAEQRPRGALPPGLRRPPRRPRQHGDRRGRPRRHRLCVVLAGQDRRIAPGRPADGPAGLARGRDQRGAPRRGHRPRPDRRQHQRRLDRPQRSGLRPGPARQAAFAGDGRRHGAIGSRPASPTSTGARHSPTR